MSELTLQVSDLHDAFVAPLVRAQAVVVRSPLSKKPLEIDLRLPLETLARLYLYSLVDGGSSRPGEFKINVRIPGQGRQTSSFDFSGGRVPLAVGYHQELDVFVLWDAGLHVRVRPATNLQVPRTTVLAAATDGCSECRRKLGKGSVELVLACQSWTLRDALRDRLIRAGDHRFEEGPGLWELSQG